MMLIKPSSVACESVFSRCSRFMTRYRAAMEPDTMDSCVFLNGNPFLFEKALNKLSKTWRPAAKFSRAELKVKAPENILEAFNIDWNTIFDEEVVLVR